MRTESGRCLIFAMQMVSGYLARLARAARRVQGPRSGTFRKLEPRTNNLARILPPTTRRDDPAPRRALLRRRHGWLKGQTARPSVRPRWSRTERICRPKGARSCAAWRRAAADLGLPPADLRPPTPRSQGAVPKISGKKAEICSPRGRDLRTSPPRSRAARPEICDHRPADLRPPRCRSGPRPAGTSPEICGQI